MGCSAGLCRNRKVCSDYGNFDTAETIFYNRYLNASEIKFVHCYLSTKYAMPLSGGISCP